MVFMHSSRVHAFQTRRIEASDTFTYCNIFTGSKDHLSKNKLKLETEYEDKLVSEFNRHYLFEE